MRKAAGRGTRKIEKKKEEEECTYPGNAFDGSAHVGLLYRLLVFGVEKERWGDCE